MRLITCRPLCEMPLSPNTARVASTSAGAATEGASSTARVATPRAGGALMNDDDIDDEAK
jgi:hypothetical protein